MRERGRERVRQRERRKRERNFPFVVLPIVRSIEHSVSGQPWRAQEVKRERVMKERVRQRERMRKRE